MQPSPASFYKPSFSSIAEEALWRGMQTPPPAKADVLALPVSKIVEQCLKELEVLNQSSHDKNWSVSSKTVKNLAPASVYRPPRCSQSQGFAFDGAVPLDPECQRARIAKPMPSTSVHIPLSSLERWESRERQAVGAASQLDLMSATLAELSSRSEIDLDSFRQVLMSLSRTTAFLAAQATCNLAELVRARRSFVLDTSKFLLLSSKHKLLSAPLASPFLFGGMVKEVLTEDKEDQIHARVAGKPSSRPPLVSGQKRKNSSSSSRAKKKRKIPVARQPSASQPNRSSHHSATFSGGRSVQAGRVTFVNSSSSARRGKKGRP